MRDSSWNGWPDEVENVWLPVLFHPHTEMAVSVGPHYLSCFLLDWNVSTLGQWTEASAVSDSVRFLSGAVSLNDECCPKKCVEATAFQMFCNQVLFVNGLVAAPSSSSRIETEKPLWICAQMFIDQNVCTRMQADLSKRVCCVVRTSNYSFECLQKGTDCKHDQLFFFCCLFGFFFRPKKVAESPPSANKILHWKNRHIN